MKLFVDAHSFDNGNFEGVTTYIKGIYRELTRMAPDIDFYFGGCDTQNLSDIFGQAANIHYLQYGSRNKYKRLAIEIPRLIKRHKIDVAHYQYTTPLVKRCREIVTIHDILFKDFPELFPLRYRVTKELLFGRSARNADLLLTVSEYSKERLQKHYGVAAERICVTPNAVADTHCGNHTEVSQSALGQEYILFVSRIEPRKNHILLLEAYTELELWRSGLHLVMIGRRDVAAGELDDYIKTRLPEEAKQYVHLKGSVSDGELAGWYKNARLFVYPSLAEGFGIPPLEAAVAEVPCLCSNSTAMSDFTFFADGLFAPQDKQELKDKMLMALSGSGLPDVKQVKASVLEKYNWRTSAEALLGRIRSGL